MSEVAQETTTLERSSEIQPVCHHEEGDIEDGKVGRKLRLRHKRGVQKSNQHISGFSFETCL
jgi:hypothetical protein